MRLFLAALALVLVLPVVSGCWKGTSSEETRRDASVDQILGPVEGTANISEGDREEAEGFTVEEAEQQAFRDE